MKAKLNHLFISLTLGLGLTLALLWLFDAGPVPVARARDGRGDEQTTLTLNAPQAQAGTGVIRVALTGTDTSGCGSVITPCLTIQFAVDEALPGEEIRIAGGVYTGVQNRAGVTQTVYISKNLTLRGGYTITNWTTPNSAANPTILDAGGTGRVMVVSGSVVVTVENLSLTGGDASVDNNQGGGLYIIGSTVTLSNSQIYSNTANQGGGIFIFNANQMIISDSRIEQNVSLGPGDPNGGGGIYNSGANTVLILTNTSVSSNTAQYSGGGIYNVLGTLTLHNTKVNSNTATTSFGGGLYNRTGVATISNTLFYDNLAGDGGGVWNDLSLSMVNSTLSGNTAKNGAGLYNTAPGSALLTNTTIYSNVAVPFETGGGIYPIVGGSVILRNTIIANNLDGLYLLNDCVISATITSNGYNLDSDDSCNLGATGDITNTNPLLNLLADNGGSTETHLPAPNSPVIDAGNCDLSLDQRNELRPGPGSNFCDIGAVEVQNVTVDLSISKVVTPTTVSAGDTITYTLVFSNAGSGKAGSVVITDIVPSQLSVISYQLSVDAGVTLTPTSGITYEWTVSDLAAGQGGLITISGQIALTATAGVFTNTVEITGTEDITLDNNTASAGVTIISLAADLELTKRVYASHYLIQDNVKIAHNLNGGPSLANSDNFGYSVSEIGDLNGDGIIDMAVGASGDDTGGSNSNRGAVYVLFMKADGTVSSSLKIAHNLNGGPALGNGDDFGWSVSGIDDLNGDGVLDMAVGAHGDDTGGSNRGAVYVLFMKADGTVSSRVKIAHNLNGGPVLTNTDRFGWSVSGIDDLNGDGVLDIAVAASLDDTGGSDRGAVYVLFMKTDGTVSSSVKIAHLTGGGPVLTDVDRFGRSVSGIGDRNGDGVLDMAVGAYGDDTGGSGRGAVYVLFMKVDGTVSSSLKIAHNLNGGPLLANGDRFGSSVSEIGDLNGDGVIDLAVGALADDTGGNSRGAVYALFMKADGTVSSSVKIAHNLNGGPVLTDLDRFGFSASGIGDLNGDGVIDMVVGARTDDTGGTDRGAVYVLFGQALAQTGESITYTLILTNSGSGTAGGVVITDIVPSQVLGVSGQWSVDSGVTITPTTGITYEWTVSDLAAGQGGVITISGQIDPNISLPATFTNSAQITTTSVDGDADNNSDLVAITVIASDLEIAKSVTPTTATPGETITYTLAFTNNGPYPAYNAVITDIVPISLTAVSGQWSVDGGATITPTTGITYAWTVDNLAAGQSGLINITGQIALTATPGIFTNTVKITGTGDITPSNNNADAPLTVTAPVTGVNTFNDDNNVENGNCTLREAILAANTNVQVDACPAGKPGLDVITLTTGVYSLTVAGANEDATVIGDLDITEDLAIIGVSSDTTIIDAASLSDRVFHILAGTVVISNVTIRNGSNDDNGGGIFNIANLKLVNTTISGNQVSTFLSIHVVGGGIDNAGNLELIDSVVSYNTVDSGSAGTGDGGGIHSSGLLTLTQTIVNFNKTTGTLGGVGGGIFNDSGTVTLVDSRVTTNTATNGGGLFNDGTGILDLANSTVSNNQAGDDGGGLFNIGPGGVVTLTNSTIISNTAGAVGGGIYNIAGTMTLSDSLVSLNRATGVSGGGIYNDTSGIVELVGSTVSTNTAGMDGGGVFNKGDLALTTGSKVISNSAKNGGGLYSADSSAIAKVTHSIVSGNQANDYGGGMKVSAGMVELINVTVSGNTAGSQDGGGIKVYISGTLVLTHTTISSNTSPGGGSGLDNEGGTVTLKNTVIANNVAASDCNMSFGVINSAGHNLIGDASCSVNFIATGDIANTNPLLGPLQDNGGNTETHALLSGSPAIDTGFCMSGIPTDQRGQPRPNPVSLYCDIGAYESAFAGVADLAITKAVNPTSITAGQTITFTLTFTNVGPITATGVVITDIVPVPTMTNLSVANTGVAITATPGITYSWQVADLGPGAGGVITVTGQITNGISSGIYTNTAIITSTTPETNTFNNQSDVAVTVTGLITPPNSLSISGPAIGTIGVSIGFDATVSPISTKTPLTYVWQATNQTQVVRVTNLTDTVGFTWGTTGIKVITVTATNAGGTVTSTHIITISTISADLEVVKIDTPDPVTLGGTLHYTIIITNNGPFNATGLVITDTLPSLSFAGAGQTSPAGGISAASISCALNGNLFVCNSTVPLPPGSNLTLDLDLSPNTAGTLTNQVEVSANEPDPTPGNNAASVDTTVMAAVADLSISKVASPDPVTVGEPLTYTLDVANSGPAPALGVTLVDPLPSGVSFGSVSTTQGTCNPANGTVTCVLDTMYDGTNATVTIVAIATAAGIMTNTATVAASIGIDPDPTNNAATITTTVESITTTVNPGVNTTLIYTDTQGNPTTIFIPTGAVTETISLVYAPLTAPTSPGPPYTFAAHTFTLTSYRGITLVPGYVFLQPLTITVKYSDADVAGLDESTLMLYYLDTGIATWVEAATTCTPTSTYQRFTSTNTIAVPICHLTEFALTGTGANQVYLPVILKETASGGLSNQNQAGNAGQTGPFESKGAHSIYLPVILREE